MAVCCRRDGAARRCGGGTAYAERSPRLVGPRDNEPRASCVVSVAAVNIDGGGSSVAVYKGKVVSHPTCADTPVECERAVLTTTCVSETVNV